MASIQSMTVTEGMYTLPTIEVPRGNAVVESQVDSNHFLLRFATSSIMVTVTKGSLKVGDLVLVDPTEHGLSMRVILPQMQKPVDHIDLTVFSDKEALIDVLKLLKNDELIHWYAKTTIDQIIEKVQGMSAEQLSQSLKSLPSLLQNYSLLATVFFKSLSILSEEEKIRIAGFLRSFLETLKPSIGTLQNSPVAKQQEIHCITITENNTLPTSFIAASSKDLLGKILLSLLPQSDGDIQKMLEQYDGGKFSTPVFFRCDQPSQQSVRLETLDLQKVYTSIEQQLVSQSISSHSFPMITSMVLELVQRCGKMTSEDIAALSMLVNTLGQTQENESFPENLKLVLEQSILNTTLTHPKWQSLLFDTLSTDSSLNAAQAIDDVCAELNNCGFVNLANQVGTSLTQASLKNCFSSQLMNELFIQQIFNGLGFTVENTLLGQSQGFDQVFSQQLNQNCKILLYCLGDFFSRPNNFTVLNMDTQQQAQFSLQELMGELRTAVQSSEKAQASETTMDASVSKSVFQSLSQKIQGALQCIEVVQLLSRPAHSPDGIQQVLIIPVYVEDQWQTVPIKLVTQSESDHSTKKRRNHIRCMLSMELSITGLVHACLDFEGMSKPLNIAIDCQLSQTVDWLTKDREQLQKSLLALGFPSIQCVVRHIPLLKTRILGSRQGVSCKTDATKSVDIVV